MKIVPRVAILGGGISGITTGIVLQMHGFATKIYTHHRLDLIHPTDASRRPPELASIHAAASVLPHSAIADWIPEVTRVSQEVFHRLAFCSHVGVRQQRHYELYEKPTSPPAYAREVRNFEFLADNGKSWVNEKWIPRRKGAAGVWGWHFNAFFAEVPTYIQSLYSMYETGNGDIEIVPRSLSVSEFAKRSADFKPDVLVVCAGYGSPYALGKKETDLTKVPVTRGHIVKVDVFSVPRDIRDQYFSYNYTPDSQIKQYTDMAAQKEQSATISKEEYEPADVYFYPRSDGWLLGGSRQHGFVNLETGVWQPKGGGTREEFEGQRDYFKRHDSWVERIPKRIWDLNRELVLDITEVDISRYPSSSYIGYRFLTNPIEVGYDAEASTTLSMPVYGNYGHGGSGYTLSWGCAWKLLVEMEKRGFETNIHPYRTLNNIPSSQRPTLAILTTLEDLAHRMKAERDKPDYTKDYES